MTHHEQERKENKKEFHSAVFNLKTAVFERLNKLQPIRVKKSIVENKEKENQIFSQSSVLDFFFFLLKTRQ